MNISAPLLHKTLIASALSTLLLSSVAVAEKHEETKQHGAHEHGVARVTIATTDKGMEVSLESPAANVFGFEYLAKSDEDHHTIHSTVTTLKKGDELLVASAAAGCKQSSVEIKSAQVDAHKAEKHPDGEHDHDHDDHDKHDDHKDSHDDHDHHDHKSEGTHNDVDVTWNFECEKPAALEQVEVRLFSIFPKGFQEIDVDWISATKSGSVELKGDGVVLLTK